MPMNVEETYLHEVDVLLQTDLEGKDKAIPEEKLVQSGEEEN